MQTDPTRGRWKHRLSEVNPDTRSAVCAKCGVVRVKPKDHGKLADGRHWRCVKGSACESRCTLNERRRRQKAALRVLADSLKTRCIDCGFVGPPQSLDFDHLPRYTKVMNVAALCGKAVSEARLRAEIAKCEVVCANCHRMRTKGRKQ